MTDDRRDEQNTRTNTTTTTADRRDDEQDTRTTNTATTTDTLTQTIERNLRYLSRIDKLTVMQEVQPLNYMTEYEIGNRYKILNAANQIIFHAVEQTDFITATELRNERPFEMILYDNMNQPVFIARRPYLFRLLSCCANDELTMWTADGRLLGTVSLNFHCCYPRFKVTDYRNVLSLHIEGPFLQCLACCKWVDTTYQVLSIDRTMVGKIIRHFPGFVKQLYTYADNYTVTFPKDLSRELKVTLLGASFLIDYLYHERKKDGFKKSHPFQN